MGNEKDRNLKAMFAAGAYSAYVDMGMSEEDAEKVASEICKQAAKRLVYDDDEDDTWWSRNKWWALPSAIGAGAFLLGANSASARGARPDRGHWSNAASYIWNRVKALFGVSDDPMFKNLTEVSKRKKLSAEDDGKIESNPMYRHFMGGSD